MRRAVGGALAWVSIGQFFVTEELVRRGWTLPYSRSTNFISDLGALTCGTYRGREICSPGHVWMNVSFGLVGVAVGVGAVLLRASAPGLLSRPVLALYAAAGTGSVLVGVFPEDTVGLAHVAGTGAFFVGSSLAHVLLGWRLRSRSRAFGAALALVGAAGLVGTALILAEESLGLGIGFVERVVVYGADAGFIATGLLLLASRTTGDQLATGRQPLGVQPPTAG